MSQKFEIDRLEERIAPSTLAIGTVLDHAVSGNAIGAGNSTSVDAGHNSVSASPTISPTINVNTPTVVNDVLNSLGASSDGSASGGFGL